MSVPAFKNSKSKVRRRRSHHHLTAIQSETCKKCASPVLSHRACKKCGYYNNRQVIKTTEEVLKKVVKKPAIKKAEKKTENKVTGDKKEIKKEKTKK